jgi:erythromycin esterase-like protein
MLAGPTLNHVGEASWRDRNDAVRDFFEWMKSAKLNDYAEKEQAMMDQFSPAVIQQVVNRAGD